jgi:hypothetical protein
MGPLGVRSLVRCTRERYGYSNASLRVMEPRRSPKPDLWQLPIWLLLFIIAMAGIYFIGRGVGDFLHGGSHQAGITYVLIGVACYVVAITTGRPLKRRNRRRQQ